MTPDFDAIPRILVTKQRQLDLLLSKLALEHEYAADTEYAQTNEYSDSVDLAGLCFYLPRANIAYYIPINHSTVKEQLPWQIVRDALIPVMADRNAAPRSLWHFFKTDYKTLKQHGLDVWDHKACTYMAIRLLDENLHLDRTGLKWQSKKHFGYDQVEFGSLIAINEILDSPELSALFGIDGSMPLLEANYKCLTAIADVNERHEQKLARYDHRIKEVLAEGDVARAETLVKRRKKIKRPELAAEWRRRTTKAFLRTKRIHDVRIRLVLRYATDDPIATYYLWKRQQPQLRKIELEEHLVNYQTKLSKVLGRMELRGVPINLEKVKAERLRSIELVNRLEMEVNRWIIDNVDEQYSDKKFFEKTGKVINLGSGQQLSRLLYRDLKLTCRKMTKKNREGKGGGQPSTDADALGFHKNHPLVAKILEWRLEAKILSTYLEMFLKRAVRDKNGVYRIHPSFNQYGAKTGRLSCSKPNLQNQPRGARIRCFYEAPTGWICLVLDYSQIELRELACFSGDEELTRAYTTGNLDVHQLTASKIQTVLGNPTAYKAVTKEQRYVAKTVGFGVMYGLTAFGLAQQLNVSEAQAEQFIQAYRAAYPSIEIFTEQQVELLQEQLYLTTFLGRRRRFPELRGIPKESPFGKRIGRQGFNSPIQGGSMDITGASMIRVEYEFYDNTDFEMSIQVHDEIIAYCEAPKSFGYFNRMKSYMTEPFGPGINPIAPIPLVVEGTRAKNWGEAKG